MKGFALGLALKQRRKETWKSPVSARQQTTRAYECNCESGKGGLRVEDEYKSK